jgi:hypothetical protein
MRRSTEVRGRERAAARLQRLTRTCVAGCLVAIGCGGDGGRKGDSTIRFQLTTTQTVTGLASVQLSADTVARTFALQTLSPTATTFDLAVPPHLLGTINVSALARPTTGCMGYAGMELAFIGAVGETVTVTLPMEPRDICQQGDGGTAGAGGGTAGTGGGAAGTGGATGGSGGTTGGSAGGATAGTGGATGGTGGAAGRGGSSGVAGTGGATGGTGGAAGRGGTGGAAGTGGATGGMGGAAGRGGTGGAAGRGGTGGAAGTGGGVAGTGGGAAGRGGTGGAAGAGGGVAGTGGGAAGTGGGAAGTGGAAGCTGTPASLPSLTCCREFDHLATPQVCDGNDTYLYVVAFTPDGTKLLTGGDDDRVKVWNFDGRVPTASGVVLPASPFGFFAISPNGMNVAVGDLGTVDVWATSNWSFQRSLVTSGDDNYGIGFAPDNQRVISIDYYDQLTIHSITDTTALATAGATVFGNGLAVAPTQLASGLGVAVPGLSGNVSAYSVTGTSAFGTELYFEPSSATADMTAVFSPNGTLLAVGDTDSNVRFWNYPLATAVTPPTGATITIGEPVLGVAFSPNGQHIAITGGVTTAGSRQGSVSIWNVATRTMVSRFNLPAGHTGKSVAFSPNGSALVVGEYGCGKITVCSY